MPSTNSANPWMSKHSFEHWKGLTNLILVAGHAVYIADDFARPAADESWYLQPFQKGEAPFYIEHIRKGVELAVAETRSLLVFSGGQTRREAGPRSEALSYWMIANHFHWWWRTNVSLRATTEEYARDSFENLLFGICRFFECAGKPPQEVTVVSWAFKKERFDLHRQAIQFPPNRFHFVGVNDPIDLTGAKEAETDNAKDPFEKDPYATGKNPHTYTRKGNTVTVNLKSKREERNPMNRTPPYALSYPDLKGLLEYSDTQPYPGTQQNLGQLPW